MARFDQAFNSEKHDDMGSFDPIPPEWYSAKITGSTIKDTSAGTGKYLALKIEIIGGDYNGRVIWTNLNIQNPNQTTVEIAQKELATICRAVGVPVLQDTNQLHGIPMMMKVKTVPAKGDWPAKNAPCGYKPMEGGVTGAIENPNNPTAEEIPEEDVPWENDKE